MHTITEQDYRAFFSGKDFSVFEEACPNKRQHIIDQMRNVTFEYFISFFDFEVLELPLDPKRYTNADWDAIEYVLFEDNEEAASYEDRR